MRAAQRTADAWRVGYVAGRQSPAAMLVVAKQVEVYCIGFWYFFHGAGRLMLAAVMWPLQLSMRAAERTVKATGGL